MTMAQSFRPFLDTDGSQIGWQSQDGSVVVAMDQLGGIPQHQVAMLGEWA